MKAIILGFTIVAATITACNNDNNSTKKTTSKGNDATVANNQTATTQTNQTASVDEVLNDYLKLKNALAIDNANSAAEAGKQMIQTLQNMNSSAFSADQKKVYDDVKDDMREHAEHISTNAAKIEHQREHFDVLSKDMYDFVKAMKPSKTLYLDHCPMYNDNKGANWLSEEKEIKNPYLGKKMPDCGTVKEEIKQ